jgi:hypothetical protein
LTLELRKAPKGGAFHPIDDDINRIIAKTRARLFGLGNLFLVRRKQMA